jgi:hypothetical protein
MTWSRERIDIELGRLEHAVPGLLEQYPEAEGDFYQAFAGIADCIVENAGAADCEHVHARISCILSANALIPGENEGESCAEPSGG